MDQERRGSRRVNAAPGRQCSWRTATGTDGSRRITRSNPVSDLPHTARLTTRARGRVPVSTTRLVDTEESTGSAVPRASIRSVLLVAASRYREKECSTPLSEISDFWLPARLRLATAFASLSTRHHTGRECSCTHSGPSVETSHDVDSLVATRGFMATKSVPPRSHLYSSVRKNVSHAVPASVPRTARSSVQALCVRIIHRHEAVFAGVVVRQLVEEVTAFVFPSSVAFGHDTALFLPIHRPVLFPREGALRTPVDRVRRARRVEPHGGIRARCRLRDAVVGRCRRFRPT